MPVEQYNIHRAQVTKDTRLYAAEPCGVRLTVTIAGADPPRELMHVTDATDDAAVRRLSARIVQEFMQRHWCVSPAGLPPGAVHDRVLAALEEARSKRSSDRDRAVHYLSLIDDEIAAMLATAASTGGDLQPPPVAQDEAQAVEPAQAPEVVPEPVAAVEASPPVVVVEAPEASPAPAESVPAAPQAKELEAAQPEPEPTAPVEPAEPAPAAPQAQEPESPVVDVRQRWQATAYVGELGGTEGRLVLYGANHNELAVKMAKCDRRWWEIGAVGSPTPDFMRDAFARWVIKRELRRIEPYEQHTLDRLWLPYSRFMVGDPTAGPPRGKGREAARHDD